MLEYSVAPPFSHFALYTKRFTFSPPPLLFLHFRHNFLRFCLLYNIIHIFTYYILLYYFIVLCHVVMSLCHTYMLLYTIILHSIYDMKWIIYMNKEINKCYTHTHIAQYIHTLNSK